MHYASCPRGLFSIYLALEYRYETTVIKDVIMSHYSAVDNGLGP